MGPNTFFFLNKNCKFIIIDTIIFRTMFLLLNLKYLEKNNIYSVFYTGDGNAKSYHLIFNFQVKNFTILLKGIKMKRFVDL